jgi:hypothetical protein
MGPSRDFVALCAFWLRVGRFGAGVLVLTAPLWGSYVWALRSTGELLGAAALVEASRGEPHLWLSGYLDSGRLKTAVARRLAPRLAVIGSSRVMQYRGEMFRRVPRERFYNLGGDATNATEARLSAEALAALGPDRPELIIVGLDFSWFQTRGSGRRVLPDAWGRDAVTRLRLTGTLWLDRIQLLQRAWRDPRFREALRDPDRRDPATGRRLLGIGARGMGGFRNDGSYCYSRFLNDPFFPSTSGAERRKAGVAAFAEGRYRAGAISAGALDTVSSMLASLRASGVEVVVVLPPVEPGMLDLFRRTPDTARFWRDLAPQVRARCRAYSVPFHDFTDPRVLGADHRAFFDWLHASEWLAARGLLAMLEDPSARAALAPFVERRTLSEDLESAPSTLVVYPG